MKALVKVAIACILVCGSVVSLVAQDSGPRVEQRQQDDAVIAIGKSARKQSMVSRLAKAERATRVGTSPQLYTIWHMEFEDAAACQAFDLEGVHRICSFEQFTDVFVPVDDKGYVDSGVRRATEDRESLRLRWIDESGEFVVPPALPPATREERPREAPDEILRGGLDGLTGHGVIVAIIDSGIDFRHPDFVDPDEDGKPASRLLHYWDTVSDRYANGVGAAAKVTYPDGSPIGTIFSNRELTGALQNDVAKIPVWDVNGHGTACAGVAAGNGRASNGKYAGVAPRADIIGVRIDHYKDGNVMNVDNAYLIGAICKWLDELAGDRPLVISCSWGGQYGGRDGEHVLERQLSARFSLQRRGRAICFAAGNEGTNAIHSSITFGSPQHPHLMTWTTSDDCHIRLYVKDGIVEDLYVSPLLGTRLLRQTAFQHRLTGDLVLDWIFAPGERCGVKLFSRSATAYQADAYISGRQAVFTEDSADLSQQIGAPGAARNVVTVGSYDWNHLFHRFGDSQLLNDNYGNPIRIGAISAYSNPGPLRRAKAIKPEIVGPGQWHTSPAPSNVDVAYFRDTTGHYQLFNGTSAATPYVAGVIALLMEKKPDITLGEVKSLLERCATNDRFTGKVPNARWGHGKLDVAAVRKMLETLK